MFRADCSPLAGSIFQGAARSVKAANAAQVFKQISLSGQEEGANAEKVRRT